VFLLTTGIQIDGNWRRSQAFDSCTLFRLIMGTHIGARSFPALVMPIIVEDYGNNVALGVSLGG